MFQKIKNRNLLIIFIILAILATIVLMWESKKGDRSFKEELFKVDSARVTCITIYPKTKNLKEIKLQKTGKNWEIKSDNKTWPADTSVIQNILQSLAHIKVERVAGTDKESWKEFNITDTASVRVVVNQDAEIAADFRLGKISFAQSRNTGYGGRGNFSIKTHLRVADDDNVYVVEGALTMMLGEQVSQYRNKNVLKFDVDKVEKLSFVYPADSSFTLIKAGDKWMTGDKPADSAQTVNYLNALSYISESEFADDMAGIPAATHKLVIEGNSMNTIEVRGSIDTTAKKYYMSSTYNPSANFAASNSSNFYRIFANANKFEASADKAKKNK